MEILKSQWRNKEHTVFTAWINTDNYKNLPYGVNLESDDTSQVHKELVSLYNEGKIEPEEYEEPEIDLDAVAVEVRSKRDRLLAASDKFMLSDFPILHDELSLIIDYRQSLRDISKQDGFPLHINWPPLPVI